jgi:hypothetical protein
VGTGTAQPVRLADEGDGIAADIDGRVGTIVRRTKKGKEDTDERQNLGVGHHADLGRDSGCQRHRYGPRAACKPVG